MSADAWQVADWLSTWLIIGLGVSMAFGAVVAFMREDEE